MAELHLIGYLEYASNFTSSYSLFCRYSFQTGSNWTILTGLQEGQTLSAKTNQDGFAHWAHPLDLHFVSKGLQGWPKILLQVGCLDAIGRSWTVGYSFCSLPSTPGHHILDAPCWVPTPVKLTDKIRQYFLGGSHQLLQSDIISLGSDRFRLKTKSQGSVRLSFDVVLRNFDQFGVEYK